MLKRHKIFTYCAIGTIVTIIFSNQTSIAQAEEIPIAGINLVLDDFFQNNEVETLDIKDYLSTNLLNPFENISLAQVTNYVNIRETAGEDGKILGKLYNNSAAKILNKSGDWYQVKSGTVTGYIMADFLITGEEAEKLARKNGTRVAVVNTTTLKIRKEANIESEVLTLVPVDAEFPVKKEQDGWVEVTYEGDKTGYVSSDFVELKYEFDEAVSIKEEQERLEAEQTAITTEQRSLATENTQNSDNRTFYTSNTINNNASSSSIRNKIVQYALQFEGNPYVWGGTSLTQGADCSGFTQSVFSDNGIYIPRTSRTQAVNGRRISLDNMQAGDLIFYEKNGTINHVGIYIGNGKIISASSPEIGIRITNYNYRQPVRVVSYIND